VSHPARVTGTQPPSESQQPPPLGFAVSLAARYASRGVGVGPIPEKACPVAAVSLLPDSADLADLPLTAPSAIVCGLARQ
jgi:hypothetical protein